MESQLLAEPTEPELLHRAKTGDFGAFQQLMEALQPRIYGLAFRIQAELQNALDDLDEKYRLVFLLRDVEGLSVRETAEALEITESNVKVRLLRARLSLRERLTKKFGDASQVLVPDHNHS